MLSVPSAAILLFGVPAVRARDAPVARFMRLGHMSAFARRGISLLAGRICWHLNVIPVSAASVDGARYGYGGLCVVLFLYRRPSIQ